MPSVSPSLIQTVKPCFAGEYDGLLSAALESAPVGLIVLNADCGLRLITRAACFMLGLSVGDALLGMPLQFVLARCPSLALECAQAMCRALLTSDGEPREVFLSVASSTGTKTLRTDIRTAAKLGWVVSIEDVTATRQARDWLLEHASTDPITGLWNRQHFLLMLQDRLFTAETGDRGADRQHALLLVGLHRFKQVNDALGLGAGDAVLRQVAERLSSRLCEDDMLARFAGEEFALFVSRDGGRDEILALAERISAALSLPYLLEGQPVTLTAHVGVANVAAQDINTQSLASHAGLALAETTLRGSGAVCLFDPAMTERARLRRTLEGDLRLALARGEFELAYQPQVDVRHQRVTGLEALIRWRNAQRGLVSPAEFIPLAEQIGLINDIGDWVLRQACRAAVNWPDDVTIAVNASPLQFETGHFATSVGQALHETGLPARRLEIEITESLLLRDTGTVMSTLSALQTMGVRLVLDDFGTGYASLSQLSRFRFDKIKIDRSFVSPTIASIENSAIVRSIAALGTSLGIPTTAEGVETESQLAQIKADGCTSVQGYYYSRPVPGRDVEALLTKLHQPLSYEIA